MSRPARGRRAAPRRLIGLLTALWCLLPFMLLSGPAVATPPTPTPSGVEATLATDQPGLGGAVPDVLAQAGVTPITLTLTLQPAGATFDEDATFDLEVTLEGGGAPAGTLSLATVTLPGGQTSDSWTVTYSAVDNGVVVTPRLTDPEIDDFAETPAAPFQSLKRITTVSAGPGATTIGGEVCGADSQDTACATVRLPNGTMSSKAATTVGVCTSEADCPVGSEMVGFIADLGTEYTVDDPAQIVIRCDRSLCGRGSIHKYVVHMSFEASGPLDIVSRPCVAKGVALDDLGNHYCTDYVSSHRNKGDLLLVVNVLQDYRGAV